MFQRLRFWTPPAPAEYLAGLDRRAHADPARRRPRALSGRFSPRRAGLISSATSAKSFGRAANLCRIAPCSTAATWNRCSLPPRLIPDEGRTGVDRLQRPSQHGLLQRAVRPRGGRGVRTARLRRRLCKEGILHLHRRGACALPARTERGRPGAGHLPVLDYDSKRMHYFEQLFHHAEKGWVSATSENMSLHVDMAAKKTAPFPTDVTRRLIQMKAAHGQLPRPEAAGRRVAMPERSQG